MFFVIILFIILYLVLAWKRLDLAVMLMLVLLPSYQLRFSVLGIPMTVLEVMILVAFGVWFFKETEFKNFIRGKYGVKDFKENRKKRTRYPFRWEIAGVLLVSWIAIVVAGGSASALGIWKAYFFEPVLVFLLVLNVFRIDTDGSTNTPGLRSATAPPSRGDFVGPIAKVLWTLTIGAFWVSGLAIIERLTGWFAVEHFWPRVTGPFLYPNALGLFLGPLILILFGWFWHRFKIINYQLSIFKQLSITNFQLLFIGVSLVMSVVAIILAKSEGALVGILAGATVFAVMAGLGRIKESGVIKKMAAVLGGLVLIVMLAYPLITLHVYPKYWYPTFGSEKVNYLIKKITLKDLSGEIRKQQWRETWEMMVPDWRWLLGTGLSGYQAAVKPFHVDGIFYNFENDPDFRQKIVWFDEKYKGEHWQPVEIYMYPHNFVLNFWVELGLVGALIFIWIIIKYFYTGFTNYKLQITNSQYKGRQYINFGLLCAMVVMVTHGLVDVPYFKNDLAVIFWVLVAMMAMIKLQFKAQIDEDNKQ